MKVLFDHQIYTRQKFGGISRYFNELMKMEADGVTIDNHIPVYRSEENKPVRNDLVSRGVRFAIRKAGLKKEIDPQAPPPEMKEKILKAGFDIFHPTYFDPYFLSMTDKPFVLTVYDMIHEIFKESFDPSDPTSHNKRLLCDKAAAILSISHNTKKDLVDIFHIPEEKVHVTSLASDFDQVSPVKPAGAEGLGNYILFTGARWTYKNFYFPVTALADVLKEKKDLRLVCSGHPFSNSELAFFQDLGISRQVRHIYLQDDRELAWAYRNAALFIFPSLYEGFGFPILEAFASRCPVISSRGGSLQEVAGDGALFFNPKNANEIREAAYSALYDNTVRNRLIGNGNEIFKKYSWERCRQETLAVYKNVMENALT